MKRKWLLTVAVAWGVATTLPASDWPTYMRDNARSGVSPESLASPLAEQWVVRSPAPPQPAWSDPQPGYTELPKVKFDDAFYTVAVGDRVYFGSSVDNQVHALDAATGRTLWTFTTGGPIRLAPTFAGDRVYFGSDDGKVYCLNAADGTLRWSRAVVENSRRVLGNGRVISLWPVRTSVVVENNRRVYVGAGVFPHEGVFMLALNADDGSVIWKSDDVGQMMGGFSPQGYLLMCKSGIMVPSGRNGPVCVDRTTGRRPSEWSPKAGGIYYHNRGGTYGVMVDQALYFGTQSILYRLDTGVGTIVSEWPSARRLLATPEHFFVLRGPPAAWGKVSTNAMVPAIFAAPRTPEGSGEPLPPLGGPFPAVSNAAPLWTYERADLVSMILAGNRLVAGAGNEVVLLEAATGQGVWTGRVDGVAVGLTVANGRLLVSTTEGAIHCFATNAPPPKEAAPASASPLEDPAGVVAQAVQGILRESGIRQGYALVVGQLRDGGGPAAPRAGISTGRSVATERDGHLTTEALHTLVAGSEAGRLARELARCSELKVTCVEFEPQQALATRKLIEATGLPAERLAMDMGSPEALPYPDYAANLVVQADGPGQKAGADSECLRILKPCGGVMMRGMLAGSAKVGSPTDLSTIALATVEAGASNVWEKAGIAAQTVPVIPGGTPWTKRIRGELEGSGWWTHAYADAGNTGSSGDRRVHGRLGVLWFGEPGPAEFWDRHLRSVPPLVMNGRVFCQGWRLQDRQSTVLSFDAYNGLKYWERTIPGAIRLGMPSVPGNLACTADSLFVAAGSQCHRLDVTSGVTQAVYETPAAPDGSHPDWGYVAVVNGILYGSVCTPDSPSSSKAPYTLRLLMGKSRYSDALFAVDLASGKQLWAHRGKEIRNSLIALSRDRLFFVENRGAPTPPMFPLRKKDEPSSFTATVFSVVSLEAATGKPVWEKAVDFTGCGRWDPAGPPESAGYRELQALCTDDVLVFASAFHQHDAPKGDDLTRRVLALSTRDGRLLWSQPAGNLNRPVLMQNALLAPPSFRDLQTGEIIQKPDPRTGKAVPWTLKMVGGGCGSLSASDAMVFRRGGWHNVLSGPNVTFTGMRAGCFINIIPAGGIVVQPEASSGCTCSFAVQCTIAFRPEVD